MKNSKQKIHHTTSETYECDREFERKRQTNVCNSADAEDLPHKGDRFGSGGLGLGRLRSMGVKVGGGVRGLGLGGGVRGLGRMSHLLGGESSVANLPCGESSGNS